MSVPCPDCETPRSCVSDGRCVFYGVRPVDIATRAAQQAEISSARAREQVSRADDDLAPVFHRAPLDDTLAAANDVMTGPRQDKYGDPVETLTRLGVAWGSLLAGWEPGTPIAPRDVAWLLVVLKAIRDTSPGGEPDGDNPVDAAAYAAIAGRC